MPEQLDGAVQFIDVRDLAAFMVAGLERGESGVVNVTGPLNPIILAEVLEACARVAGTPSRVIPVPCERIEQHKVAAWTELPLWLPAGIGVDGLCRVNLTRARELGLAVRPLEQTIEDTLRWAQTERAGSVLAAGLTPEREAALLVA